jgi:hypothetical protein
VVNASNEQLCLLAYDAAKAIWLHADAKMLVAERANAGATRESRHATQFVELGVSSASRPSSGSDRRDRNR